MKKKISPDLYSKMLTSINLASISLVNSSVDIYDVHLESACAIDLHFTDKYTFESSEGSDYVYFFASFKMTGEVAASTEKEKLFSCSAKYKISYSKPSDMVITKDFFEIFKEINLPQFIWPYFREYIQNMISRAGMPPLVLPSRIFNSKS
ncbi:hypothetical protein [Alistipes sp.]|uniref:hypothetical protein n=1 Tax=Alistipes sp. TaxID=1872444 RepID=UPI003A8AEFFD